jgi:hypothetical protein
MPFKAQKYAFIKDNEVVRVTHSCYPHETVIENAQKRGLDFDECIAVDFKNPARTGAKLQEFTDNDIRKPRLSRKELYDKGLLEIDPEAKIDENNQLVPKTDAELVEDGLKVLEPYQKINPDTGEIERKSWAERYAEDETVYEEWLDKIVRHNRDTILREVDIVYLNPERWDTYTPEQKQAWSDYKQLLRDFPDTNPPVTEWDEIQWPEMPK